MGSRGLLLLLGLLLLSAELMATFIWRRCRRPPVQGPCVQSHLRFYYDQKHQKCLYFIYGGCKGNRNRFRTKERCERVCKPKGQGK
ncbi:kunitz-type serine protease inhibitor 28-like [Paroedura picta]|uniref:kunitz-type serine protease inhibitor 28-like n=1 Tax=Paroedura picta TaxID=143630 RepID=UPI004057132B